MSNEEKILSMLTKMQADIDALKTSVETLKGNGDAQAAKNKLTAEMQYTILETMRDMLTDEEKDALGRYQAAEEARKAALYG